MSMTLDKKNKYRHRYKWNNIPKSLSTAKCRHCGKFLKKSERFYCKKCVREMKIIW